MHEAKDLINVDELLELCCTYMAAWPSDFRISKWTSLPLHLVLFHLGVGDGDMVGRMQQYMPTIPREMLCPFT